MSRSVYRAAFQGQGQVLLTWHGEFQGQCFSCKFQGQGQALSRFHPSLEHPSLHLSRLSVYIFLLLFPVPLTATDSPSLPRRLLSSGSAMQGSVNFNPQGISI